MHIERRIAELGLVLPERLTPPPGIELPFPFVRVRGSRAFVSGHGPLNPDGSLAGPLGKVARRSGDLRRRPGACIIAEGIETSAELETLRRLGIGYGQGYFLGRPGPLVGIATLLPMAVATPIVHGRVSG